MRYEHGGDIYTNEYRLDFSSNINPFGVSPTVKKRMEEALEKVCHYPDRRCGRLKRAVSGRLDIDEDMLIFGNGAADLLFSLVLADKPKKGMILAPAFQEYEQALVSVGCQILVWERKEETDFSVGEEFLAELEKELAQGLDMVFLCSPDNPTGALIPKPIIKEAVRLCESHQARIVVDESFYEFAYESEKETMLSEVSEAKSLFILRSFTKMYGIPGLRLGYGISSDRKLMERMELVRQPWSVSIPAQEAGIAATCDAEWAAKVREYVRSQRSRMEQELRRMGFKVYPSEANYLLFYSPVELVEPLKKQGILIRDCSNYRGLSGGYYRVAVKLQEENRELLDAIGNICKEAI